MYNTLELIGTTVWNKQLGCYVWQGKIIWNGDLAETAKGSHRYTWNHCTLDEILDYFGVGKNNREVLVIHKTEQEGEIDGI